LEKAVEKTADKAIDKAKDKPVDKTLIVANTVYNVTRFIAFLIAATIGISGMLAGTEPLTVGLRAAAAFFSLTILGAICARILHSTLKEEEEDEEDEEEKAEAEETNQEQQADELGGLIDVVLPETAGEGTTPGISLTGTSITAA
jgi:hypothetical protein